MKLETEVNGESKRANERGPFLVGSLGWLPCPPALSFLLYLL
jgi:hypothetical protein